MTFALERNWNNWNHVVQKLKIVIIKISGHNYIHYSNFFQKKIIIPLVVSFFLISCETDNMYSSAYCRFTFNASLYPSSALTRSVGSTGGDFCIVKAVSRNGITHLLLTPNRGNYAQTDLDLAMNTAISGERISYAGMGYRQGLILGRSLSGQLRCYDLMCPNCDFTGELKWGSQAYLLECSKCHRIYNIDGDYSYVESGEKGHLEQYKTVNYNAMSGRLEVRN